MTFKDADFLNDIIFDFYMLFDEIQNNELIPLPAKCILLNKYLKLIKKEYLELKF